MSGANSVISEEMRALVERGDGDWSSVEDCHVDALLHDMVGQKASDLHIAVGLPPIIRVSGQLKPLPYTRITPAVAQRIIYDIITDEQIRRFEEDLELDCAYSVKNLARFRLNVFRDKGNVAAAFRTIPVNIPTLRDLMLPRVLDSLTRVPRGLILVTGPTGSGKSTTLAAMIHQINCEHSLHIVTIEDPIEYLHSHRYSVINQREVGQDTRKFHNALRASLREDPDVILVGEMRDQETISLAVTAAETGHLVFGTLHTNSAGQTVDRMVDVMPEGQQEQIRFQLSNNLQAVICQQLIPRAGADGRVCAMEIMIATPAVRNLIREGKSHQIPSAIQTGAKFGMQTMDQHLRDLYMQGVITYDDAVGRAMNPDELRKMIESASGSAGRATTAVGG